MGVFHLQSIVSNAKQLIKLNNKNQRDIPKGYLAVYVGEVQKKLFVVPLSYLDQPLFQDLLSRSEDEFGFNHPMVAQTTRNLIVDSKQASKRNFIVSIQARDGKQESSSKSRQARVNKKETGGKQETAIDEKAENTVKECTNWKDKKKDKEQEALLISEDTTFVITGENIGPKPNPGNHNPLEKPAGPNDSYITVFDSYFEESQWFI
ncbi:putative small auxin-up RNA [Tanacetum coccineum]